VYSLKQTISEMISEWEVINETEKK